MPLDPGTRLGPYEIVAPLGQGGMGEVYRARDTRLGRDVAVKVLPRHLSANPEIRSRFEREAKTVSSLNHPNICVLFDVGREGETDYLVMELVEGETLAERLLRGALPSADLLRYGTQIADALDRAHRAGVVHRDLKPGNVMITKSGAKLMDFGLARVTGLAPGGESGTTAALSQSPTIAQALTAEGSLLGTFQYMSPEQLEGREADARSDIWALGCVLYEMVTGRRAFEGRSQASLIAAILERDPAPVGEAPSGAVSVPGGPPHGIERLIRNCLTKDPDERVQTAHDVKLQLQGIAEGAGIGPTSVASGQAPGTSSASAPRRGGSKLAWGIAALGLLAAAGAFAWLYPRTITKTTSVRFRVDPPAGLRDIDVFWPRVSPDGRYLMVVGVDSARVQRAYLRPMDQLGFHAIPGTEAVRRCYWSPDGREVAFVANDRIQRVSIAGGTPVVVCAAPGGADLSWGSKGQILMDGQSTDSLRVVPAGGGELKPASRIDRAAGESGSAWPCFLPDGEHFLFIGNRAGSLAGNIRLGRLGSLDSKLLGTSDGRVEYAPGGWVLFLRETTLLAQKLDLGAGRLVGEPITIRDDIRIGSSNGHFSVSRTGILAFSSSGAQLNRLLRAADREGSLGPELVSGPIASPELSPDGRRLLYALAPGVGVAGGEIYVFDLERRTNTRLTFTGDSAVSPVWSPDGRRFAYMVRGAAGQMLRIASADGLGGQDSILIPPPDAFPMQWVSEGSRIPMFRFGGPAFTVGTEAGSHALQSIGDTTRTMFLPRISPDGRWLVGAVGSGTNFHVYVQSLQGPRGQWQISTAPGFLPRWTREGRELLFESIDGFLMAVDIDTRDGFRAGTPRQLFKLPISTWSPTGFSWTCDGSGERFYLVTPPPLGREGSQIEVVTGFENLVSRK